MTYRIFRNWTWIRVLYLGIGAWIMVQSAINGQWMGVLFGAWPAAMGLFSLGCASGNCATRNSEMKPDMDPVQE